MAQTACSCCRLSVHYTAPTLCCRRHPLHCATPSNRPSININSARQGSITRVVRCGGCIVRHPSSGDWNWRRGIAEHAMRLAGCYARNSDHSRQAALLNGEVEDRDRTLFKWDSCRRGRSPWVWLYNLRCVFSLYLSQSILLCHLNFIFGCLGKSVVSRYIPLKQPLCRPNPSLLQLGLTCISRPRHRSPSNETTPYFTHSPHIFDPITYLTQQSTNQQP